MQRELLEVSFRFERETKNTLRYEEVSEAPVIGTLYVQKLALPGRPAGLFVRVEELVEDGEEA